MPVGRRVPGEKSRVAEWSEVAAVQPEVVVAMPCGYDAGRAAEEAEAYGARLAELGARTVVAVNASASSSVGRSRVRIRAPAGAAATTGSPIRRSALASAIPAS